MKFIHLIPVPNHKSFDKHLDNFTSKTKEYLLDHQHTVDSLILGPEYNNIGWCEELLFYCLKKGMFNGYDYVFFSHSDVLVKKFDFLDYIKDSAFGRAYYFVVSVPKLIALCNIKVKYEFNNKKILLSSIFHGEKVPDCDIIKIFCNDVFFKRSQNLDHCDHILYLNHVNELQPPFATPDYYDHGVNSIHHFHGVGVGSQLLIEKPKFQSIPYFPWKFKGLINYVCHKFRFEDLNYEEFNYLKQLINFALNSNLVTQESFKKNLLDLRSSEKMFFKVGLEVNHSLINNLYDKFCKKN
jgi:hypothetical protein